jgi:hypothetical protein
MQFTTALLTTLLALAPAALACGCERNSDAGRWKDTSYSPSHVVDNLSDQNGGCYSGSGQGKICVKYTGGGEGIKTCVRQYVQKEQSHHGDWFLWTSITCNDGGSEGTVTLTKD